MSHHDWRAITSIDTHGSAGMGLEIDIQIGYAIAVSACHDVKEPPSSDTMASRFPFSANVCPNFSGVISCTHNRGNEEASGSDRSNL